MNPNQVNKIYISKNNSDHGAKFEDLRIQIKIVLQYLKKLYESKFCNEKLFQFYENFETDQIFIRESFQEAEFIFTSKKLKDEKKTFDKINGKSKSNYTKYSKKRKRTQLSAKELKETKKNQNQKQKNKKKINKFSKLKQKLESKSSSKMIEEENNHSVDYIESDEDEEYITEIPNECHEFLF